MLSTWIPDTTDHLVALNSGRGINLQLGSIYVSLAYKSLKNPFIFTKPSQDENFEITKKLYLFAFQLKRCLIKKFHGSIWQVNK